MSAAMTTMAMEGGMSSLFKASTSFLGTWSCSQGEGHYAWTATLTTQRDDQDTIRGCGAPAGYSGTSIRNQLLADLTATPVRAWLVRHGGRRAFESLTVSTVVAARTL